MAYTNIYLVGDALPPAEGITDGWAWGSNKGAGEYHKHSDNGIFDITVTLQLKPNGQPSELKFLTEPAWGKPELRAENFNVEFGSAYLLKTRVLSGDNDDSKFIVKTPGEYIFHFDTYKNEILFKKAGDKFVKPDDTGIGGNCIEGGRKKLEWNAEEGVYKTDISVKQMDGATNGIQCYLGNNIAGFLAGGEYTYIVNNTTSAVPTTKGETKEYTLELKNDLNKNNYIAAGITGDYAVTIDPFYGKLTLTATKIYDPKDLGEGFTKIGLVGGPVDGVGTDYSKVKDFTYADGVYSITADLFMDRAAGADNTIKFVKGTAEGYTADVASSVYGPATAKSIAASAADIAMTATDPAAMTVTEDGEYTFKLDMLNNKMSVTLNTAYDGAFYLNGKKSTGDVKRIGAAGGNVEGVLWETSKVKALEFKGKGIFEGEVTIAVPSDATGKRLRKEGMKFVYGFTDEGFAQGKDWRCYFPALSDATVYSSEVEFPMTISPLGDDKIFFEYDGTYSLKLDIVNNKLTITPKDIVKNTNPFGSNNAVALVGNAFKGADWKPTMLPMKDKGNGVYELVIISQESKEGAVTNGKFHLGTTDADGNFVNAEGWLCYYPAGNISIPAEGVTNSPITTDATQDNLLSFQKAGHYLLTLDTYNRNFSVVPMNMYMEGAAVNNKSTEMTFDPEKEVYTWKGNLNFFAKPSEVNNAEINRLFYFYDGSNKLCPTAVNEENILICKPGTEYDIATPANNVNNYFGIGTYQDGNYTVTVNADRNKMSITKNSAAENVALQATAAESGVFMVFEDNGEQWVELEAGTTSKGFTPVFTAVISNQNEYDISKKFRFVIGSRENANWKETVYYVPASGQEQVKMSKVGAMAYNEVHPKSMIGGDAFADITKYYTGLDNSKKYYVAFMPKQRIFAVEEYKGADTPTGVEAINGANKEVEAIYTLGGVRLDKDAQPTAGGIYLVKYTDGTVAKKVMGL